LVTEKGIEILTDYPRDLAGLRIILQQAMGHVRPAAGFPDQPDLIFGFDITHFFDDPF
jgi:hypothetical protein